MADQSMQTIIDRPIPQLKIVIWFRLLVIVLATVYAVLHTIGKANTMLMLYVPVLLAALVLPSVMFAIGLKARKSWAAWTLLAHDACLILYLIVVDSDATIAYIPLWLPFLAEGVLLLLCSGIRPSKQSSIHQICQTLVTVRPAMTPCGFLYYEA